MLRYGGQPYVFDLIHGNQSQFFANTCFHQAMAGSIIGISEVALLPLDTFKIKKQTSLDASKSASVLRTIIKEKANLYKGWSWTIARNAPGQFALFGTNSLLKHFMGLDGKVGSSATISQNAIASCGGAAACLVAAQPFDVIKTRLQARPFDCKMTGMEIATKLIQNEGLRGFLKGLPVKLLVVGPKIAFSFTIAQTLISLLSAGPSQVRIESVGGRLQLVLPENTGKKES